MQMQLTKICVTQRVGWRLVAGEALRLREDPGSPSLYADRDQRRRDTCDLLAWVVADGTGDA